jgi:phosphate acetyltransferase
MYTVERIRNSAKAKLTTIVLPEYNDPRVLEAARIIEDQGIAKPLILGPDKVNPKKKAEYIEEYYQMHKAKGVEKEDVKRVFEDTLYYAAMMVHNNEVGGLVAGASHTTPDMARASIRCLGIDSRIMVVSSCFIMVLPDCPYAENGTFIFADCGIIPDPNARQLAYIALSAAELGSKVLGLTPRIALLSYSTKGSANGRNVEKIVEALKLLKAEAPDLLVDGEMQVDTAIIPEVAKIKYPDSPVGGKANIMIFPNLESGNISYKLVQRLAGARAIGPLILGLNKPCSDLSRGCLVEDIVDCVAVTAIRAQ